MKAESNTLYSLLEKYIQEHGHLTDNRDQLRYALVDINEIKNFAYYKASIVIDSAQAKRISETGLQWLSYAQLDPTTPEKFTEKAQEKLKDTL